MPEFESWHMKWEAYFWKILGRPIHSKVVMWMRRTKIFQSAIRKLTNPFLCDTISTFPPPSNCRPRGLSFVTLRRQATCITKTYGPWVARKTRAERVYLFSTQLACPIVFTSRWPVRDMRPSSLARRSVGKPNGIGNRQNIDSSVDLKYRTDGRLWWLIIVRNGLPTRV